MKSSNTRRPLHQQNTPEQKGPFFSKANDDAKKKDDAFFQTKLAVGEPGDKHEQEADKVADKVQKKTEEKEKTDVQKKGEDKDKETDKNTAGLAVAVPMAGPKGTAPDMAHKDKTPANKDATGGNAKHGKDQAADMPAAGQSAAATDHKDKAPDPKSSAGQAASSAPKDKLPGQGAAGQMTPKDEEKPAMQKMSDGDKKDEDKTKVNKKEEGGKQEKEDAATVMKKESGGAHAAHKVSLEERIKQNKGKGQTLPDDVRAFLESQLGADFGEVVIHTDGEAVAMNKELNSLAFTNGFDIFFNAGQYKPGTAAGQKLLAHELTHVIQQTGVSKKKDKK
jgi:hypothetical protein